MLTEEKQAMIKRTELWQAKKRNKAMVLYMEECIRASSQGLANIGVNHWSKVDVDNLSFTARVCQYGDGRHRV